MEIVDSKHKIVLEKKIPKSCLSLAGHFISFITIIHNICYHIHIPVYLSITHFCNLGFWSNTWVFNQPISISKSIMSL